MEPKYELTDNPPPDAFQKMWTPLLKFNEHAVGNANACTLAILLKEPTTDELIGGLWARSLWGSLYIDITFVPPTLRGNGIGTSLLRQAEQEAIRRGCRNMWTETYAFQARPFYERFGFSIFGRLDGPAPIFPRFFLTKNLDTPVENSGLVQSRLCDVSKMALLSHFFPAWVSNSDCVDDRELTECCGP